MLGGLGLPHAPTHAVMLPYAVAYNAAAAPGAMRRVARALGASDAATGLFALARSLGAPPSLAALGMHSDDIGRAADLAVANPYPNPASITREGIRGLLDAAFHGRGPA